MICCWLMSMGGLSFSEIKKKGGGVKWSEGRGEWKGSSG